MQFLRYYHVINPSVMTCLLHRDRMKCNTEFSNGAWYAWSFICAFIQLTRMHVEAALITKQCGTLNSCRPWNDQQNFLPLSVIERLFLGHPTLKSLHLLSYPCPIICFYLACRILIKWSQTKGFLWNLYSLNETNLAVSYSSSSV